MPKITDDQHYGAYIHTYIQYIYTYIRYIEGKVNLCDIQWCLFLSPSRVCDLRLRR